MSIDATQLLFEGFLHKRKDTMKMRWSTYWFRLQNTTLFFYTQKNGSASHLRGYYYIYTVQSVREVLRADTKRFMFEIIMTSGKRKLLAADTAALRQEWIGNLWQAMHLSTTRGSFSKTTRLDSIEQRDRTNSSLALGSHSDSDTECLPVRPLSAPAPSTYMHPENSITCPVNDREERTYQNIQSACSSSMPHNVDSSLQSSGGPNSAEGAQEGDYDVLPLRTGDSSLQWSSGLSSTGVAPQGDYDILPLRTKNCEIDVSTETDEGVYDFPVSYQSAEQSEPRESIYDVPSSLLRKTPGRTSEEQPEAEDEEEEDDYEEYETMRSQQPPWTNFF